MAARMQRQRLTGHNGAGAEHRAAARFAAGDHRAAAKICRQALKRAPRAADLWHLLAAAELAVGRVAPARQAVDKACALSPASGNYNNTRALVLERAGAFADAEHLWRRLLDDDPDHADAGYNLARSCARQGDAKAAVALLEHVVACRPQWAAAWLNLGEARFECGDEAGAEHAYSQACRCSPQASEGYENLARLRERAGDFEGAQHWYKQALTRAAGPGTLVRFALSCPIFCADQASIDAHRARIEGNVAALEGQPLQLTDGPETVGAATFYLPYQGRNDVELATRIDRLLTTIWQPSPLPARPLTKRRPRVAFVSAHFRAHTVGRFYAPLLEMLPRDEFELAVLSVGQHDDALASRIAHAANDYSAVPCAHAAARAALHDMDADIVVYPDVGMEPVTSWLASERLAPVQCAGWGHPVTTGRSAIDHFISSAWVEPPDAETHYSENLVALTAWPAVHEDPGVPSPRPARTTFGFAADDRIYLCPQSLFKFHPDFDAYLRAILERDGDGRIVLLESRPAWRAQLEQRFAHTLGTLAERIRFLPYLDSDRFKALLVAADVILDTLHFGGGYTSFETLWSEVPFVTERGRYMRGRVTAGFADLVGAEDALVEGAAVYAERAVELATPGARRANFIDTLRCNKQRLVDMGPNVVAGYMNFFRGELDTVEQRRSER